MKESMNRIVKSLEYSYIPLQPGFENKCENYVEMKLSRTDALSKIISVFYQFKITENVENFIPVIPDGCIDKYSHPFIKDIFFQIFAAALLRVKKYL